VSRRGSQDYWVPGGATLLLPPRMRLAASELERLWKGLERFANCDDSDEQYRALGRAFPEFWPADIQYFPNQEPDASESTAIGPIPRLGESLLELPPLNTPALEEISDEEIARLSRTESLNWNPVCHRLFRIYRDTLRFTWQGEQESTGWLVGGEPEFLLGISDWNERAHEDAKNRNFPIIPSLYPYELYCAWESILDRFSTAWVEGQVHVQMLWREGDFYLAPRNDFERAFYRLFRESWRARMCARCKMFFVARRPKQMFCGTVCSAGSRLASKRKWWKRVGAKRRGVGAERVSKRLRKGGRRK
jgi:hypothetical protein